MGELEWGWAGVSAEILQPIRKRKAKKKEKKRFSSQSGKEKERKKKKYSPATGKGKEKKKKKEEGFKSGIWPVLCCGCLMFLHPLGT